MTQRILVLIVLLGTILSSGQDIKYTFANAQNTNEDSKDYYEVDILIESTVDFKLGSGQLYFNYNTAAFGENISANSKLEYTQPTGYILGEVYGFPAYKDFIQNDNTGSRVSISYQQGVSSGTITANNVTATPKNLFHLKIEYTDFSKDPMITFETGDTYLDQTFTACGPAASGFPDCTNHPGEQLTNDTFDSSRGIVLGINDDLLTKNLKLYPNPVSIFLTIDSKLPLTKVEIYSILGQRVKEINTDFNAIPTNYLARGIYMIKIYSEKGTTVRKLIKK